MRPELGAGWRRGVFWAACWRKLVRMGVRDWTWCEEMVFFEEVEGGEGDGRRRGVAGVGVAVEEGFGEAIGGVGVDVEGVEDFLGGEGDAQGHVAGGEAFGEAEEVGETGVSSFDSSIFDCWEGACCQANIFPVRPKPVRTSSAMRRVLCLVASRRSWVRTGWGVHEHAAGARGRGVR